MAAEQVGGFDVKEHKPDLRQDFTPPTYDEWRQVVDRDLKGVPFEKKLITKTYEGINLKPLYTRDDIKDLSFLGTMPGYKNFVRGTRSEGYLKQSWLVAQALPYALSEDFNEALRLDLGRGQDAINFKLDKATMALLDADYAPKGDVGSGGLSISAINSIERALKGIDLEKYPLFIQAGYLNLPMLMLLSAYLRKTGANAKKLKGSLEADPVAYLLRNGTMPVSITGALEYMAVSSRWAANNAPLLRTVGVDSSIYVDSGASAVQELGYSMATASEYMSALIEGGLSPDQAASSIRFTFGVGPFYFMEIAKLRAARMLWAKIAEAYGAGAEVSKININARTTIYNQTRLDPYVNMLRGTTEAFSAIAGGVSSLELRPFDEAYGIPDEFSRRMARNTQIILKEESHLNELIDPAGGSYYVESLTDEVAQKAWALFAETEESGGFIKALTEGKIQKTVYDTDALRRKDIGKRKSVLVGTNMYANMAETPLEERESDYSEIYRIRGEYLQKFRTEGSNEDNKAVLDRMEELLSEDKESIVETGAKAYLSGATIGEVSASLKASIEGETGVEPLKPHRAALPFETLREAASAYRGKTGKSPRIFFANMGPLSQHKARADFSRGYFEAGGFEVISPKGFATPEDAATSAIESGANAVCICSTDDSYPEIVPPVSRIIKEKNPGLQLLLAGYPKDNIETFRACGVDDFIYLGSDLYGILSNLMKKTGVME